MIGYDAGLLSDYGGGNVEWWQDYIRAEISRANDHWLSQCDELQSQLSEMTARAMSMVFMIPPDTLAGDLQKFKDECKELLERSKAEGGDA